LLLPLFLSFLLFPSPLSLPLIGHYIRSTQSGHGVTIPWHRFRSQLRVAEWRQIEQEMLVGRVVTGRRADQVGTCVDCKGNLTILRRILYLDLAKGNTK
jgi:hypothetical protein